MRLRLIPRLRKYSTFECFLHQGFRRLKLPRHPMLQDTNTFTCGLLKSQLVFISRRFLFDTVKIEIYTLDYSKVSKVDWAIQAYLKQIFIQFKSITIASIHSTHRAPGSGANKNLLDTPVDIHESSQERPPDGPRSSTPIIFKKGSMILFLRSSVARRSLSFVGVGTDPEIRTRANIDASEDSTAWRRAAAGFFCEL